MAPKPFKIVKPLPAPLSVEETAAKFGVSRKMVRLVTDVVRGEGQPHRHHSDARGSKAGTGKPATTERVG